MTRLAVLGFGLIGASIAAGARARRLARHVAAIDRAEVLLSESVRAFSDEQVDVDDRAAVHSALSRCDLAILAAPVSAIIREVGSVLEAAPVVTDCGSTKREIVLAVASSPRARHFVPGHPLAGSPVSGAESASADLFDGRTWVICPDSAGDTAVSVVSALVRGLGAIPVAMSAAEHDRAVALTSHVPQLLASALLVLSARRGARVAEGPGFASATRVAGGGVPLWKDIFQTNADEIASALRALADELNVVAGELVSSPPKLAAATELLRRAREERGPTR